MAIRINRVYTRTGDDGETRLVGGASVRKDSPRVEAYGTVDELNSVLGLARSFNEQTLRGQDRAPAQPDPSIRSCGASRTNSSTWEANSRPRRDRAIPE